MSRIKGIYFPIVDFKCHAQMMREFGPAAPTIFNLLCLSQKTLHQDPVSGVQLLEDERCELPANLFKQFGVTPGKMKKHLEYFESKAFLDYTLEKSQIIFTIAPRVYLASQSHQYTKPSYMTTVEEEEKGRDGHR